MLVKCCRVFYGMNLAELVKEGDIGRIMGRTDCFGRLELLTYPLNTTFLA